MCVCDVAVCVCVSESIFIWKQQGFICGQGYLAVASHTSKLYPFVKTIDRNTVQSILSASCKIALCDKPHSIRNRFALLVK